MAKCIVYGKEDYIISNKDKRWLYGTLARRNICSSECLSIYRNILRKCDKCHLLNKCPLKQSSIGFEIFQAIKNCNGNKMDKNNGEKFYTRKLHKEYLEIIRRLKEL